MAEFVLVEAGAQALASCMHTMHGVQQLLCVAIMQARAAGAAALQISMTHPARQATIRSQYRSERYCDHVCVRSPPMLWEASVIMAGAVGAQHRGQAVNCSHEAAMNVLLWLPHGCNPQLVRDLLRPDCSCHNDNERIKGLLTSADVASRPAVYLRQHIDGVLGAVASWTLIWF